MASWDDLWAIFRFDFRLSETEFLRLTPRRMHALFRRLHAERKWWSWRFALVISSMATRKDGSPLQRSDLERMFPELRD